MTMISSASPLTRAACTVYCLASLVASPSLCMLGSRSTFFAAAFVPSLRRTLASASATSSATTSMTAAATPSAPPAPATLEEHSSSYKSLLDRLRTITHLNHASSVLNYDRQVFMPQSDRTSAARGKQLAVLATIAHEKSTDPAIGELIDRASEDLKELLGTRGEDRDGGSSVELKTAERILELERDSYEKRVCIPSELAARKAELGASANHAWVKARKDNDFASFAPKLKECFDTAAEVADLQRGEKKDSISLYSQMLDAFEMGMPASRIDALFDEVQSALVPFIAKIRDSPNKPSLDPLKGKFPVDSQKEACFEIVNALGFDGSHGRLDVSVHPFTMSLSGSDVRITSRFDEAEWYQGLAGAIHEGGHAMYEQNLGDTDLDLDSALSMGVHESQSLFWERHVGKGRAFFDWAKPILSRAFGTEEFSHTPEELYAAVNAVDFANLIRVEADELTYPLHVILRYNIERDVVAGDLDVADIPARWNKEMKEFLDIDVPDDARGCLQDIHWSCIAVGYFPTYLLGSMMAAQLCHYCKKDMPGMDGMISRGEFEDIRKWLTKKVHVHGKRYKSLDELLEGEVGEPLNSKYFIDYLTQKYSDLYKVC